MRGDVTRMTPNEFVAALRELKLSQNGFAKFTGTNDRTVRRWAHGQQDIPQWVRVMLELWPNDCWLSARRWRTPTPSMGSRRNSTRRCHAMTDPSTEPGAVAWHSSDEGGGPDVGLSIGLGDGKLLWVGETPDHDGWRLAIYHPAGRGGREDLAQFDDAESGRTFFEELEALVRKVKAA